MDDARLRSGCRPAHREGEAAVADQRLDTTRAHPARRYDYWLGGKDNFAADRQSGDLVAAQFPAIRIAVVENRKFLRRAVTYLAEQGIRQFLDIGTGLPTAENVHQVAQHIAPESRVVYVDNDPLVLAHARALLTSTPEGKTAYLDADLRDAGAILADPVLHDTLNLTQPVALMLVSVLHFVTDDTLANEAVSTLLDAVPPGSYLVLSHATNDFMPPEAVDGIAAADRATRVDFAFRTREQIASFPSGLQLIEPGIVSTAEWRPDPGDQPLPDREDTAGWCLVAHKPPLG
ncbi:SAM-dependent methyltransferase [Actinoplanes sp. NPDC051475]|uniref:SAM-dependent methyltransferase n=1 Tax=Actinoplanes sp. NPDC051475 TaxID=3157225 RepID=UPI00344CA279